MAFVYIHFHKLAEQATIYNVKYTLIKLELHQVLITFHTVPQVLSAAVLWL